MERPPNNPLMVPTASIDYIKTYFILHKKNVWNSKKHVISNLTIVTTWVFGSLIIGFTFNI